MKYYTFIALTICLALGLINNNANAKKAETIIKHKNISSATIDWNELLYDRVLIPYKVFKYFSL